MSSTTTQPTARPLGCPSWCELDPEGGDGLTASTLRAQASALVLVGEMDRR